jgi:hypothetical protein
LVPVQVGIASPSLEVNSGESEAGVANTTEAVQIGDAHDRSTNTGIHVLPLRSNKSTIRSALSNE